MKRFRKLPNIMQYTHPNEKYEFQKKIGDGSASKIYISKGRGDDREYIIKRISKGEEWRAELRILKMLKDSDRLLKFIDSYFSDRFVYIVTEFYPGFDLFEHMDINVPFKPDYAKKLIKEMALCIKELHDLKIAHLDIKCENFMVRSMDPPRLILIDFGHAEKIEPNEIKLGYSKYGTCFYLCPEGYTNYYSMKSDIWSLGICIHLFLTGDYPFEGDDRDYERNVVKQHLCLDTTDGYDELIKSCLEYNPQKRWDIEKVLQFLEGDQNP